MNKNSPNVETMFAFISKYTKLTDILTDHDLASLGDAYVNLVYSLALSKKRGIPIGRKTSSSILASALHKANLRRSLAARTDRHRQADAVEALMVYAWLVGAVSLEDSLILLEQAETSEDGFASILKTILKKLNFEE